MSFRKEFLVLYLLPSLTYPSGSVFQPIQDAGIELFSLQSAHSAILTIELLSMLGP